MTRSSRSLGRRQEKGSSVEAYPDRLKALALHELATNAINDGALAQSGARLTIGWTAAARPDAGRPLAIDWTESGVAMPPGPERRGFGRDLIKKALGYSLRSQACFELGADGIRCRIEMPL